MVEETFRLPARSYVLAAGTVDQGVIGLNDPVQVRTSDGQTFAGVVEQIETHSPPGKQVLGIGGPAADHLTPGTIIEANR